MLRLASAPTPRRTARRCRRLPSAAVRYGSLLKCPSSRQLCSGRRPGSRRWHHLLLLTGQHRPSHTQVNNNASDTGVRPGALTPEPECIHMRVICQPQMAKMPTRARIRVAPAPDVAYEYVFNLDPGASPVPLLSLPPPPPPPPIHVTHNGPQCREPTTYAHPRLLLPISIASHILFSLSLSRCGLTAFATL